MTKFIGGIFAATILLLWISAPNSTAQNLEKLCRQVYTDCQACSVFESECKRPNRPKPPQRPSSTPAPAPLPTWPPPQPTQQTPAPPTWPPQPPQPPVTPAPTWPPQTQPPPHNCVQYGQWCQSDKDCCTKHCQLELVTLGEHHYTQSVCR